MPRDSLLRALATSFLAGEQTIEQIAIRAATTLGREPRWLRSAAQRYLVWSSLGPRPRRRAVIEFLLQERGVRRTLSKRKLSVQQWLTEPQRMQPAPAAVEWELPALGCVGDLAQWFWLEPAQLEWFADLKGLGQKNPNPVLNHYHYTLLSKASGGVRLIEAPKRRLRSMQRQVLEWILDKVPPHPNVHGFVKGRSIQSFAAPHTDKRAVLRMDLRDFFPSFSGARIQTFFRTAGYPESVADLLGGICTNAVPHRVWDQRVISDEARDLYSRPHLPQGAPTSPSLANICSWRLDCRLTGLAASAGAAYTRYADDLAFSGGDDFSRRAVRFSTHVAEIAAEEGFQVNHRKTRIMRQGVRQHLAGLVVNRHVNIMRPDFDLLKATLTNCMRLGPATQNREGHPDFRAHLAGRVSFFESVNAERGKKLRAILDRIDW